MTEGLWSPLIFSLRIAATATLAALLVGVPMAYVNARRRYWGKSILEALAIVPMVLPPTVVGYLIIVMLGARGVVGQYLQRWFSFNIMFTETGAVLAAAVVALPLLYLPARAAFAAIDRDIEDTARVEGANRLQIFWHVSLPMALRGIVSGTLLAFARALGEFGATMMVFGSREGYLTLPLSVYQDFENRDMQLAIPAVILLCALSLVITLLYNRSALSRQG